MTQNLPEYEVLKLVIKKPLFANVFDTLDTMTRDFTAVGSRPKSEVRRRIDDYSIALALDMRRRTLAEIKVKLIETDADPEAPVFDTLAGWIDDELKK